MAEHLLQGADFGPPGKHVRGEAVTKGVRTDLLSGTNPTGITPHQFPEHHPSERTTGAGQENGAGIFVANLQGPFVLEVVFNRPNRERIEGDDALLVPLAERAAVAFLEMKITQLHLSHFRDPAAGGVQNRQESAVAIRKGIGISRSLQKSIDHLGTQDVRKILPELR